MSKKIEFICVLPNGIHARPASHIEKVCKSFTASIELYNQRTDIKADAKSVLSLIGTSTLKDDTCCLIIDGQDEHVAFERLKVFIEKEFPHCDDALPTGSDEQEEPLPRSLSNLNPQYIRAKAVCGGVASGKLQLISRIDLNQVGDFPPAESLEKETTILKTALKQFQKALAAQLSYVSETSTEILEAHQAIISDPAFWDELQSELQTGKNSGEAIVATAKYFSDQLAQSGSEYLKERELDIRDVCFQLLQHVYGEKRFPSQQALSEPTICLAEELTPSQFLELDKRFLKGLLLSHGGSTSHTVILARSFNIPTLVGVNMQTMLPHVQQQVQVDGDLGLVAYDLTCEVSRYYEQESCLHARLVEQQKAYLHIPGATADGVRIEIAANIAHSIEAKPAFTSGAESVGLFRTEMLYMDRHQAPKEDELYNTFCQALEAAKGKAIIIRTFDIGGDKPVDYLNIPAENNPFLGYRAVRIYREYLTLFRTQLRAILRASAHGALKIMIPMISSMEEILWVKEELAEIKQDLRNKQIPFDEKIQLGIMLEVPSVMFIIDQCCQEIDFFSIGSNDLTQYLLAVDRDNAKVTKHYNSLNPAFLRGLDYIVKEVHRHNKWVGLCGELGAKGSVLPLLVGLGLDEISMSSPNIPATKTRLAKLNSLDCRALLDRAMQCRTSLEVEHLLAQFRLVQGDVPLITPTCIAINPDWQSKEEVIKGMTDNLLAAGRCRYPRQLAGDIWNREDVFSTALGFGFAIPHTKSEHIEQSTISVARLEKPILWGEEQVQFVIMLTLNKHAAGDQHMRIFSKLARRIMHEEFRQALINATSQEQIEQLLKTELEL
ncbi:phosphoenolpyruvate--protein phosphotransferase [Zophobihabitans entericus]|uniref:Phosphoenolpyruvate--protein phosphotransferase n=1 Tax=Zophobihabitans entericus TaxID=1635327 RepID=A0A6G9I9B7_9GAMM|nr:phosphoenolpyruvate--protein phosphotransferase [Zophobihabitans entericus]QIQ20447.1 phosphoenolpyruvate--protein phosphotransferase [Zophobihabitans entericus]